MLEFDETKKVTVSETFVLEFLKKTFYSRSCGNFLEMNSQGLIY